jgi:hypothetical protein
MKKIETIFLMILAVCMSMSMQSCNNDDEEDFYTLTAKVTDKGNLPDAIYTAINENISSSTFPHYTSLNAAKEALNFAVNSQKSNIEAELVGNTYKYTISYIISNSKGESVYQVSLKIDGESVTIVR